MAPIISLQISEDLLERFEKIRNLSGFSSKSEALREAILNFIENQEKFENIEGYKIMNLSLVYPFKEVIIDDRLGICNELEKEMAKIVNTYQCEWKITIDDPEKMKRFRHFVNSDEKDNTVVFVQERNQIRPATLEEQQEYAESA